MGAFSYFKKSWNKDVYFFFKINFLKDVLAAVIVGIAGSYLLSYANNTPFNPTNALIGFFIALVARTILYNNFSLNRKLLNAKFSIGEELYILIKNLVHDIDESDEQLKERKLRETAYFLKANNSRTGKSLTFDPDNKAINSLHSTKGLIAITQANPSEWLNPTYNFYLINNYIVSLSHLIEKNKPIEAIKFSINRSDEEFNKLVIRRKQILQELSQLPNNRKALQGYLNANNITIRFYFLTPNEMQNNKSIIETLVAGHDLFGCYIYIVNSEKLSILDNKDSDFELFRTFIKRIEYNLDENKGKVDLAVGISDGNFNIIYRKNDDLTTVVLADVNETLLEAFIKSLSSQLYNNYNNSQYLFNTLNDSQDFMVNKEFCNLYIEKTT